MNTLAHVDYDCLDAAKNAFIAASKRTLDFAAPYGSVVNRGLGASANIFSLNIAAIAGGAQQLQMALVPEGLGTADDARPEDLTDAELREFWFNIGIKTVSVMTNDVASGGVQTLLISLYLPSSTPAEVFTSPFLSGFLDGFVEGCRTVGCVYISGETPQLISKIYPSKLDIAGAAWGVRFPGYDEQRVRLLAAGDRIVLIESSGPHENGFTSLRDLASRIPGGYRAKLDDGTEYWRAINAGSKLYTPLLAAIIKEGIVPTNIENITGHGWLKLMRPSVPLRYRIERMPPLLEVFKFVQQQTGISNEDLFSRFNCGSGMAIFVPSRDVAAQVVAIADRCGLYAVDAGVVESAPVREVVIEPLGCRLGSETFALQK